MNKIPNKLSRYRDPIGDRQYWRCRHCAIDISGKGKAILDFVIKIEEGGREDETNLQLLCRKCRSLKLNPNTTNYVDNIHKFKSIKDFTVNDWVTLFRSRVRVVYGVDIDASSSVLQRYVKNVLTEMNNPFILHAVLEYWWEYKTDYEDMNGNIVGCSPYIFTKGNVYWTIREMGGWNQPWEAYYYKDFLKSSEEAAYFKKWFDLLEDSKTADPGSEAIVGQERFVNWKYLERLSMLKLDKAVKVIRQRFDSEVMLERHDFHSWQRPVKAGTKPPGFDLIRQHRKDYS